MMIYFLVGCGGSDAPQEREVFPVSGKVTYQGKSIPDASVVLHPVTQTDDGIPACLPRGHVNESGEFVVSTYRQGDGAPAGKYRVSFSWQGSLKGLDEDQEDKLREKLPRKYRNPKTSGIEVTILKEKNPALEFTLQ